MPERLKKTWQVVIFLVKDLTRDGWRTVITTVNLLVFICGYFCLSALAEASKNYGKLDSDRSSLMVIARDVFAPGNSIITAAEFAPIARLIPEQVAAFSPLIFRLLRVDSYLIQVRATPVEDMQSVFNLELTEGEWPLANDEIVIGQGTKVYTEWKTGQQVRIYGRDFLISGVISSPGTKSSSIWMDLDAAEALFDTHGVYQMAWVKVAPNASADAVVETLRNDPVLKGKFDTFFVDHLYEQYARALDDVASVSSLLVVLSLLTIMFGTYGSIFLLLSERSVEVVILRAIGFSNRTLRGILLIRTMVQVLLAYFLSWGVSALILQRISSKVPLIANAILLDVVITPRILLLGLLLATVFGMVGVLLPMLRLSNSNIHSSLEW